MKGFHRNSSSPQIHPAQLFHRNIEIISLENKCTLEKTENWFWEYWKPHIFCEHPAVFLHPCRQQHTIYSNSCFLEIVLNLHWALVAEIDEKWQNKLSISFQGLLKGVYATLGQ